MVSCPSLFTYTFIILLLNILLNPSLPWVNDPNYPMCNNLRTTSSDMEVITRAQYKTFHIIFQLFSLASYDT